MIKDTLKYLFSRRVTQGRWVYILGSITLLLFALWGWEYGAFMPYLPIAALCIVQCFYPTMIGWGILFCVYLTGAGMYLYIFFRDLFQLIIGSKSATSILVDLDDSIVFITLIGLIMVIAFSLYKIRPRKYAT